MMKPKPVRKRDPGYLAWIRKQPSIVSGRMDGESESPVVIGVSEGVGFIEWKASIIEANHIRSTGHGGMGTKPDDSRALPFTVEEHREYHDIGKEAFELKYGLDLEELIEQHKAAYAKLQRKPKRERRPAQRLTLQVRHCHECGRDHDLPAAKLPTRVEFNCPRASRIRHG